ncbi:MAG: flagellar biosynthesis protein FlgA [candidate division NC10 bacterium]|nr:flagellar biosynthesis protein FlgA [candidate division NC10 bacterium]
MNLFRLLKEREAVGRPVRVGLIGAGKFGTMFLAQAQRTAGIQVVGVADLRVERARDACLRAGWPPERLAAAATAGAIADVARGGRTALTASGEALIASDLDVVIEATGIPEAAIRHALATIAAGRHLVMVTVEADVLAGLALKRRADQAGVVYSLAYGDQPALICELVDWARASGFEVIAAGKGTKYLPEYHASTPETVFDHYGFTREQVARGEFNARMYNSFLDSTKSAIEMAAVANATGLLPPPGGLAFPPVGVDDLAEVLKPEEDGGRLAVPGVVEVASSLHRDGRPVERDLRWGVYITFRAPTDYVGRCFQEYGLRTDRSGTYAALYRPYHLVGLELGVSIASAALRNEPTGAPQAFVADVVACAKRDLEPGEVLDGEGGYTVYGRLVRAAESMARRYLPIALAHGVKIIRRVKQDEIVRAETVLLPERSAALDLRRELMQTTESK